MKPDINQVEKQQYLNPQNDVVFKKVFGGRHNEDILINALNEILRDVTASKVVKLILEPTIIERGDEEGRAVIIDVRCVDSKGHQYIIEMQIGNLHDMKKRSQIYIAKILADQLKVGECFNNAKPTIFIALCDFEVFSDEPHYKVILETISRNNPSNKLDLAKFVFIDLKRVKKELADSDIESFSAEERLYYYLACAKYLTKEDVSKLTKNDKILKKMFNQIEAESWSRKDLQLYRARERRAMEIAHVRISDEAKGRKEGRKEGMKELAKELYDEGLINRARYKALLKKN